MRQRCVTHQKLEHRKRWAEHCKGAVLIPVGIDVAVVNGPRRVAGLVSRDTCMKRGRQTDRLRDRIEGCEHTRVSPPLLSPLPPSLSFAATHSHSLTHSLTPSLTHSLTSPPPPPHLSIHSPTHSLTHSLTQSLTHSCTHSLTHTYTHKTLSS